MIPFRHKKPPVIIGGFYRSGTSLLRRLIDAHPEIHCPPEVKFFKDMDNDYIEDPLRHVRFFTTVRKMGLSRDELISIFGPSFIRAHEVAARKLGKKRWADKNPENLLYLNEWHSLLRGKMQFVFVIRNPLDTIASLLETPFPKTVPKPFEDKVALLVKFIKAGMDFLDNHPSDSFVIKYEDMVCHAEGILIRMFTFLGEEFHKDVLTEFASNKRQRGVEDPKVKKSRSIYQSSIGRWKNDLTSKQIEYINRQTGELFKRFGYGFRESHE